MLHNPADREKKYRHKEKEDWQWYEDPYQATTSSEWYDGKLESHGTIPAPHPIFGTEPPVHRFA